MVWNEAQTKETLGFSVPANEAEIDTDSPFPNGSQN